MMLDDLQRCYYYSELYKGPERIPLRETYFLIKSDHINWTIMQLKLPLTTKGISFSCNMVGWNKFWGAGTAVMRQAAFWSFPPTPL